MALVQFAHMMSCSTKVQCCSAKVNIRIDTQIKGYRRPTEEQGDSKAKEGKLRDVAM